MTNLTNNEVKTETWLILPPSTNTVINYFTQIRLGLDQNVNFSISEKVSVKIQHQRRFLYSGNLSPTMVLK